MQTRGVDSAENGSWVIIDAQGKARPRIHPKDGPGLEDKQTLCFSRLATGVLNARLAMAQAIDW